MVILPRSKLKRWQELNYIISVTDVQDNRILLWNSSVLLTLSTYVHGHVYVYVHAHMFMFILIFKNTNVDMAVDLDVDKDT